MANIRTIYKIQLLTIIIHLTVALYEDQVGKFDWKRSFLGKIKLVSLESKNVIVATEENVLASLNLKTGDIIWRQILEDPHEHQIKLLHINRDIITVSGSGQIWLVRTWEINTGTLLTEWPLTVDRPTPSLFIMLNGKLTHIVPVQGSHIEVTRYSISGSESKHYKEITKKVAAPWIKHISECVPANTHFVCLSENQLYFMNLIQDNYNFVSQSVQNFLGVSNENTFLIEYKHDIPSVLLLNNNVAKLLLFNNDKVEVKPFNLLPNAFLLPQNDKKLIYQLEANDVKSKLISVKAKDYLSGTDNFSVDLEYPLGLGAPIILDGKWFEEKAYLLLCTTDDALILVSLPDGKIIWTREEALSNIVATEFFELPISELDASIEHEFDGDSDIFSMFSHRISTQAKQLYNLIFGNKLLQNNGLVRDEFGLHKLIVVVTRAGKLFGIDTLTGSIVWSYRLPNVQPFFSLGNNEKMLLLTQRTARYSPLSAQCVLLAQDSITGNGILFEFDPITGYSTQGIQRLDYQISQATVIPHHDRNYLKPIVILSHLNQPFIYPKESIVFFKDYWSNTYLYTVDAEYGILKGFNLKYSTEISLKVTPAWEVKLEPSRVVGVSAKPVGEQVHSQGKVLFDRSVYYKYINPNLLAVATITPDQMHRSILSMYLIDGVTGLIMYSTTHKRAKGPIHLVHSENWLVYSYFNERFRRMEISALELYEGHLQSNSTVFSSFAVSQLPDVQSQTYILPSTPLKMAVTITERGITNKFLLIALSHGAVIEIPWMFLQPRFSGMPCGAEESCIPYMPEIPIHPEAIINYNHTLARIRGIEVAPARLESTSHILVHGLDIFYTRIAPSKTFDVLREDFDHRLIVLVLSALIVATFVTKYLAARKALKQSWK